ncbi:MAG TPA: DNA repair protein RecN, partial [Candidatus Aminicenantes bacterium]|nr:DNA repair protein RecN [Candidatus Aminicenantes bacterium]
MIKSLRIRNLATIEDIELILKEGFSILTGETGAGKSIIIDGIRLVTGEKGSPDMIRTGKKETSVEVILPLHPKTPNLKLFLTESENELFIQRKISEQRTGKGYINGTLVPIKKLKEIGGDLIDIYGQNDHIFLLNLGYQLNYLDDYANAFSLKKDISRLAQELKKLLREKKELETKEREREQRLDFLYFQIKEIEKANLKQGEEEELRQNRNILKNAEKIGSLVEQALEISYTQENSISSLLAQLKNVVSGLTDFDKTFKEADEAISQFSITIGELSDFLIKFKEEQTTAPEKLEGLEERLSQIEKLKRKYGTSINDIFSYLKRAKQEHEELGTSQEKLAALEPEIEKRFNKYKATAEKLSSIRKKSARKLEKEVEKEISLLGMNKARFRIKIETFLLSQDTMEKVKECGTEEVEFLISPNPGEDLRPLRKIASGGELSRVMLALTTIGKETESLKTLIFDEIDSGIGGKTAEFVAQKLKKLSYQHQVICITHLPQIASFATHHYR